MQQRIIGCLHPLVKTGEKIGTYRLFHAAFSEIVLFKWVIL